MHKKPILEKIAPDYGSSILVRQHTENRKIKQAFWHFHPEIELVYVNQGRGKRHIGNHLSYFNNSQLILIGSNLPHYGFTDRLTANGKETLVQFPPNFLGESNIDIPELESISALLHRAKKGVLFGPETKQELGPNIEELPNHNGLSRMLKFLDILNKLASSQDYTLLNVEGYALEATAMDRRKIDIVYNYINAHFRRPISLTEISDEVSMTVPAFCRYFKKANNKTFTQAVNEYRVVHAIKLLSETELSVTDICYESGFNNFSHFNKQFKGLTGKTALNYRKEIKMMIDT